MRHDTTPDGERYLSIEDLATYSGLSSRTLVRYLRADVNPIPHFKVGGRVMIRRADFDRWVEQVGTPANVARARTRQEDVALAVKGILGHR